ncbi:penicillin-binding transpeptidase domain-containing protein [Modestobacter sp. VKM Ac-2986]|uniref:peptidoglycan D,D-transpeptidase FtsI family protein n=1 Tax=Modestobacter sp. VKM Ac-2986 TaxID=3004140 RepID=UPI0022AB055B|nr:penicillin-binding transpeptidase domain-containing protein [Modestobacter sp. VKM Ac-2986]MCZ2827364.1 penicillin-binding transpeptidase domain-containing protein [Modestobacter sp. VKM Ac-2986]
MNAPLRKVAIAVLVLFTLLIVNVNVIQVVRADGLRDNERNTRRISDQYNRERGAIVVAGNEIASSVPSAPDDPLRYTRTYAQGPLYAPVTGYQSILGTAEGLEEAEDAVLNGDDDRLFGRRVADLFTGRDPSGGNVELTLDPAVQQAAMEGLDGVTGAVVALDPATGAVLALASTPTYDPNRLSVHDPDAVRAYDSEITPEEGSGAVDPRSNQATDERNHPGSIFKVVVSAAALAGGDYTPDTVIAAPRDYVLPGTTTDLQNFGNEACDPSGQQRLIDALTISCNTAFAQLGIDLGEDRVREMAAAFGIDDETLDMPLEVAGSTLGTFEGDAQLGQSSIGQSSVQLTPMQAAMIASAVANDGSLMKPFLVDSIQAPDLSVIDQTDPEEMSQPVSAEVAEQLTTMMRSVVDNGTGRRARIDGVQVAGKTGTAETGTDAPDHNWFIGFAPADDPTIAVAVFVKNGGGTGGDTSAPIARAVLEARLGQGN